jgi:hypothetical protein
MSKKRADGAVVPMGCQKHAHLARERPAPQRDKQGGRKRRRRRRRRRRRKRTR